MPNVIFLKTKMGEPLCVQASEIIAVGISNGVAFVRLQGGYNTLVQGVAEEIMTRWCQALERDQRGEFAIRQKVTVVESEPAEVVVKELPPAGPKIW